MKEIIADLLEKALKETPSEDGLQFIDLTALIRKEAKKESEDNHPKNCKGCEEINEKI